MRTPEQRAETIVTIDDRNRPNDSDAHIVRVQGYCIDSLEDAVTVSLAIRRAIAAEIRTAEDAVSTSVQEHEAKWSERQAFAIMDLEKRLAASSAAGRAQGLADAAAYVENNVEVIGQQTCDETAEQIRALAPAPRWGVWCVEDGAWCMDGTREEAEAALPDWASGRAANVDARDFHYELRVVGQGAKMRMTCPRGTFPSTNVT